MADARRRRLVAGAGVLLTVVYLAARYRLATTPVLAETYYDEALTGLMGLAILRGEPQVFYWGQPYLGAIEGYVAALGFWFAGASTLTLRMAEAMAALGWVWSVWSVTRRIAGEPWGLVAGLAVALPPVFLSFAQLSAHGQSLSVTLGALVLAASAALLDTRVGSRGRAAAWVLLGLTAGLGWWASQMVVMFLAAAALALVVARPRVLFTPGPYVALGVFAAASFPFWVWNVQHDWATFRHLLTWGEPPPPDWSTRVGRVGGTLLMTLQGAFWDARAVRLPPSIAEMGWLAIATFYVPAVLIAVAQAGRWAVRGWRRERPWQEPLDLVVLAFWLTVTAHALTWFGTSGILRYAMTFYATFPVLGAVALARVARRRRSLTMAAAAAVVIMLAYHGATHVLFVRQAAAHPWRPVDGALATLTRLGARACYADSRIAQVITFESRERVICADYHGLRNYAFLQAVDAIEDPSTVAIVTHRTLQRPPPAVMAAALRRIGAEASVATVGDYEIFHHLRPPDTRIRPIAPTAWRATASAGAEAAALAFDRKVWTYWAARGSQREWFQLDLGRVHPLAGLTLVVAPLPDEAPGSLRVETSVDGRAWDLVDEDRDVLTGVHWWKGHPRVDESGRVVVRMVPRPARYVRFLRLDGGAPAGKWSIAELFAYEAGGAAWAPPPGAVAALTEARQALDRWMDDPGGPHPKRAPVTYARRRAQVPWATVFAAANRAMEADPEWEEAHHLYGQALALSAWSTVADEMVGKAWADRAWTDVLRWADLADQQRPDLWRSGRLMARADALAALGRTVEAHAARAAADRRARPAFRVRFENDVELVAADVPDAAHPGEMVTIRCVWRAIRSVPDNYTAFVRLDPGGGRGRFGHAHRLGASFGTSAWMPGERVEERIELGIPPDLAPGVYRVRVEVGLHAVKRRLSVSETDGPRTGRTTATIGTLTVAP